MSHLAVRLAERASDWAQVDVKPALGKWCGGSITIYGAWCEPLSVALVQRLNDRLAAVQRSKQAPAMPVRPLYHIVEGLSPMPQLLVSVRDCGEAAVALAADVDLIDVKEPRAGSLGAATVGVIDGVLRLVNGRRPVSVALGELVDNAATRANQLATHCRRYPPAFAKIGLARCADRTSWQQELQAAFACLDSETVRVAVAYADLDAARSPEPGTILNVGNCARLSRSALGYFRQTRARLAAAMVDGRHCSLGKRRAPSRNASRPRRSAIDSRLQSGVRMRA